MPRGKTKSKLSLSQRRRKAFDYFHKGYSDEEVAQRLRVTPQTARTYRKRYEEQLHEAARSNPTMLREVLANTMRSLSELDRVRSEAWRNLEDRKRRETFVCNYCGEDNEVVIHEPVSDQSRTQYLNVLLKAQDQRAKLFGVIGVKADMLVAVAQVKIIQEKVIHWMMTELGPEDRAKLEAFLVSELPQYSESAALDAIDVDSIEEAELV